MALDARRKQQKAEKRNKRRREKAKERNREPVSSLELLAQHPDAPFVDCLIHEIAFTEGMGSLLAARSLPNGRIVAVSFLVDLYCLGIKDVIDHADLDIGYERSKRAMYGKEKSVTLTPAEAKKLVVGAAEYARGLGFRPHPDFAHGLAIFAGVDAATCDRTFPFGKDGKPFYLVGPNDGYLFQQSVVATLERSVGPGNYDCLLAMIGQDQFDGIVGDPDRNELLETEFLPRLDEAPG
jgi:hypothetical protein